MYKSEVYVFVYVYIYETSPKSKYRTFPALQRLAPCDLSQSLFSPKINHFLASIVID